MTGFLNMWVLGLKPQSPVLSVKHFYPLSHLSGWAKGFSEIFLPGRCINSKISHEKTVVGVWGGGSLYHRGLAAGLSSFLENGCNRSVSGHRASPVLPFVKRMSLSPRGSSEAALDLI